MTASTKWDSKHEAERARWVTELANGTSVRCACVGHCERHSDQCATMITSETRWDLGHNDDASDWTGPECVPCNRRAGGLMNRSLIERDWPA